MKRSLVFMIAVGFVVAGGCITQRNSARRDESIVYISLPTTKRIVPVVRDNNSSVRLSSDGRIFYGPGEISMKGVGVLLSSRARRSGWDEFSMQVDSRCRVGSVEDVLEEALNCGYSGCFFGQEATNGLSYLKVGIISRKQCADLAASNILISIHSKDMVTAKWGGRTRDLAEAWPELNAAESAVVEVRKNVSWSVGAAVFDQLAEHNIKGFWVVRGAGGRWVSP